MSNHHSQSGSTLVISMIILVVLMLLGVTAMVVSGTQYKLAGNLQFEDTAMNNAETALNAAEIWLGANGGATYATTYTGTGYYTNNALNPLNSTWNLLPSWTSLNSVQATNSKQRYIIQRMSTGNRLHSSSQVVGSRSSAGCNVVNTYLITARGASSRGTAKFVQSYYSVLAC